MLLQSMEIRGFKSFPDSTKIVFDPGLTAVVGPNGSGKSNISDALRWVMGEQSSRHLRGTKMEDVIFSGTKTRPACGFAQVEIVIDNTARTLPVESERVTIRRRYDRSGESSYHINGKAVRLKDVRELLMDTGLGPDGYAIVGQGKIAEIVQSKSDQRREIFEEAAGISKYRYRQNEAQRKLQLAQDNLLRLQDILGELEGRLPPLLEQATKAKTFLSLAEEKKQLEISLWMYQLTRQNARVKDQQDLLLAKELEKQALSARSAEQEQALEALVRQRDRIVLQIDADRREREQITQEIATRTAQISVSENDIAHYLDQQAHIERQLQQFGGRQQAGQTQLAEQQQQIRLLEQQLREVQENVVAGEKRLRETLATAEGMAGERGALEDQIVQDTHLYSQTELALMQITSRREAESEQRTQQQALQQQLELTEQQDRARCEQGQQRLDALTKRGESLQNSLQGYRMKLAAQESEREELRQQLQRLEAEYQALVQKGTMLADLERNLEGFGSAVKAVMKQKQQGTLSGIVGTVAQLITVPAEDTLAIETALGGNLQHVVVETEQHAKQAIGYLKEHRVGRATFLPLNIMRGSRLDCSEFDHLDGFVGLAADLVTCDPAYRQIVQSLLGRIVIAEDLITAINIAKATGHRFRIVTRDGQVLHAGGAMQGGSTTRGRASILSRKAEIQILRERAGSIKQELAVGSATLAELEERCQRLKAELLAEESEHLTLLEELAHAKAEQQHLIERCASHAEQLREMVVALATTKRQREREDAELTTLTEQRVMLAKRLESARERLTKLECEHGLALQTCEQIGQEIQQGKLSELSLQKDLEGATQRLSALTAQTADQKAQRQALQAEQHALQKRVQLANEQVTAHQESIDTSHHRVVTLEQGIQTAMAKRDAWEQEIGTLRRADKEVAAEREALSTALARMEERLLTLKQDYDRYLQLLWDEYQLSRHEAQSLATPIADVSKAEAQLHALREQIRTLGNVNVAAIEEYQEISARYEYLAHQVADVEDSRNGLMALIEELTRTMQTIFHKQFQAINQQFGEIFVTLFGGGRALLSLSDPEDVLSTGIDILVEPPGKVIKSLSLLSGGEQALVAIAIYFAILKVNPAPFCVLDEIEAALDDVNVVRYGDYLRLLSQEQEQRTGTPMQFLMITHRRGTMEVADVLFGVTMQEEGISKLLRLPVGELSGSAVSSTNKE